MRLSDIYSIGGMSQSFDGRSEFLDHNNCKVVNMTLGENFVILNMKRDSDGEEGHAHVRVRDLFKTRERILLGLVFTNSKLLGLTLNEVNDFETSITPENIHTL